MAPQQAEQPLEFKDQSVQPQSTESTEGQETNSTVVDSNHIILNLTEASTTKDLQKGQELKKTEQCESEKMKKSSRIIIFSIVIACLFFGRLSVPDNEPFCVQDKLMDALESANKFINAPGNEQYRNFFQFCCSLLVDTVFFITFGYWALNARNVRLPISLGVFYIVRALVQSVWLSPFPEGYYWESPGIPSFVVPYGRGSDFFFSGHAGFLVICACEWNKLGFKRVRNFVLGVTAYTALILMVYRIHYSIDIFTGVIFSEWCFGKIDLVKENIEEGWKKSVTAVKNFFQIVYKFSTFDELINTAPQENQHKDNIELINKV